MGEIITAGMGIAWKCRKWLGVVLAAAAIGGALWWLYSRIYDQGFVKAQGACRDAEVQRELDVQIAASKWRDANAEAALAAAVAAAVAAQKVRDETAFARKEIVRYVPSDPVCTLGADALRLLDSAAVGAVSDRTMPAAAEPAGTGRAPAGAGPPGPAAPP